jgi:hypothetical protein
MHLLVFELDSGLNLVWVEWKSDVVTPKSHRVHEIHELLAGESEVFEELSVLIGGHVHVVLSWREPVGSLGVEVELVLEQVDVPDVVGGSSIHGGLELEAVGEVLSAGEVLDSHAELVVEDYVSTVFAKGDIHVFVPQSVLKWLVRSKLFLEKFHILSPRCSIKGESTDAEHLVESPGVELDMVKLGCLNLAEPAVNQGLANHNLGLLVVVEVQLVVLDWVVAGLSIVDHLAAQEHLHLVFSDVWIGEWLGSQVELEVVLSDLAWEEVGYIEGEWELELVHHHGERVVEHCVENDVSEEPHGVLEDDHDVFDKWIKEDSSQQVGMMNACSSKVEFSMLECWLHESVGC